MRSRSDIRGSGTPNLAGASGGRREASRGSAGFIRPPLYTPEQRLRRDASRWTLVQGILAPVQFLIFAMSLVLVLRYLVTGNGLAAANASVVLKTLALYTIMYTGALWEKDVFGRYLFAPVFFWEDVVSMAVIALHTAYLVALLLNYGSPAQRFAVALAAYATYAVNAAQFLLKLRMARLQQSSSTNPSFTGQLA